MSFNLAAPSGVGMGCRQFSVGWEIRGRPARRGGVRVAARVFLISVMRWKSDLAHPSPNLKGGVSKE
jgi:hypothetical protein